MNRKALIFILIGMLLGVGLGVGGTILAQKYLFKSDSQTTAAKVDKKPGVFLPVGEFTVNLQGGAYLKTTITIEVVDAKAEVLLKEKDAVLKDRINAVLMNKTLAEVRDIEALREDLLKKLNEVAEDKVNDVLFLTLVSQ
ncbi:MAG TPA: flagellar basal body-associated FliL family protein [Desulfosporosinus sp.]|nr:flagellar basal body-associated FliL family protein [Desulfosporosinus sp.]